MVDLATLGFEIESAGAEAGSRRINAALDAIERKAAAALQAVERFGQGLGSRLGAGAGEKLGKVEQAAIRHQQKLEQIAARREAATQRHEQRLIEIEAAAAARREGRRNQEITGLQAFLRRYSSTVREAGESIQAAGALFTSFGARLFDFGRGAIEASGRVESLRRGLQVFDGGQAPQTFERLKGQADALKTSFAEYAQSVIRVRSTQKLTADESERLVRGLINISRQVGATSEQQGRAVTALNQILSKNKVQAEELRGQLFEAIPNLAPIVEKRFGTLQAEELEKRFGAKKFVQGLIEELGRINRVEPTGLERFQAALENLALKFAPVGDKILELLNSAMEPLLGVLDRAINAFNSLPDPMKKAAIAAGLLSFALGPLLGAAGGILQTAGAIGNLATVLVQARAQGGIASIFGAGGSAGVVAGLSAINPVVLALTAAVTAGAVAWTIYSQKLQDALITAEKSGVPLPPRELPHPFRPGAPRGVDISISPADFLAGKKEALLPTQGALSANQLALTKKEAQSLINQRLEEISRGSKGGLAAAKAKLEEIRKTDAKLDEAIKLVETERALRRGLSGAGAGAADGKARQVREAQVSFTKSAAENELKIVQDINERGLKDLEELYDKSKITVREYYEFRKNLQVDSLDQEFKLLDREREKIEKSLASARDPERTRLEEKLNDVLTRQLLSRKKVNDTIIESGREFKKATALPGALDAGLQLDPNSGLSEKQISALEKVPDALKRVREERERLVGNLFVDFQGLPATPDQLDKGGAFSRAAILQNQLRGEEERIQQSISLGVIDEVQGRKQLLAIQRQFRDQLIEAAEAEKALFANDPVKVSQLEAEIESLKSLGQELTNMQRFLRGLGPGTDTGRLFEDFGSGLRNAIRAGFTDGFAGARRSFGDLLKNLAADFLTSQLVQLLRNVFNPNLAGASGGAAQTATAVAAGGGGLTVQSVLGGLGIGGGGGNIFTTPPIAGGSIPGVGGGGGFNLLGKIPGLGKLFGVGAGAGGFRVEDLPLLGGGGGDPAFAGGFPIPLKTPPTALASLGATGLLTGGFLGGSLLGGSSPIGKLLGGVGGSLGAGALGASGIFGGGVAGALPALFSNPITAIVAGGLIGGALLFNIFGNRTFKKFQEAVDQEYQVRVKGDQPGKELFKQIEQLGKAAFGSFDKNIRRTVQLDEARDLIGAYAESTNQEGSALAQRLRQIREIGNIGNPANQFVRREFGSAFFAGQTVIAGERRAEVIQAGASGYVFPSVIDYLGKAFAQLERKMTPSRGGADRRTAALMGALVEILDRMLAVPEGHVFVKGAEQMRGQIARIVREGFAANTGEQVEFSRQLGL